MYVSFCGKKTLLESDLYDICLQYSLNNIYINSVKTLYIAKITVYEKLYTQYFHLFSYLYSNFVIKVLFVYTTHLSDHN